MERVLFNIHSQVCSVALRRTSSRTRSLLEHALLLVAVGGFGVLIVSHLSFVHRRMPPSHWLPTNRPSRSIPRTCLSSIPGYQPDADVTHVLLAFNQSFASTTHQTLSHEAPLTLTEPDTAQRIHQQPVCNAIDIEQCTDGDGFPILDERIILSYSKIKGLLLLPASVCSQHNISMQFVYMSKTDPHCFGEPFLQTLVFHILGPDTVILNWFLGFYDFQGYIYNPRTKHMVNLNNYAADHYSPLWPNPVHPIHQPELDPARYHHQLLFKIGVIITSLFLFFITTTLVSFTLRATQDQMLQFTFHLQAHVRANMPIGTLIGTHVVENLVFVPIMVGMMFFLIEFYGGDKFLAFMVLSVVWVCEVFSILSMRSIQGIQFFPKTFFLLFTLFHVYYFSCPFGFSYTALASTVCFMIHSMTFFWHRYELPAVAHGLVTLENPRMDFPNTAVILPPLVPDDLRVRTPVTLPPRNPLSRQISQERSFPSTSSLGRNSLSRPPSSNGLFHDGDDGDGGDGSYECFLNGEVVRHRVPNRLSNESIGGATLSEPNRHGLQTNAEEMNPLRVPWTSQSPYTNDGMADASMARSTPDSGVVGFLTPRIGNSSGLVEGPAATRPAPLFPVLDLGS